jgi:predicted transcriptional regulator
MSGKSSQLDQVFSALAHQTRRQIVDLVTRLPGCNINHVCEHFEISRIAVMKHLDVLVGAQLIISLKKGRNRQLYFNAAPIQMIYDRWTTEYSTFWVTQVVDLKKLAERKALAEKTESGTEASTTKKRPRKTVRKKKVQA